MTVGPHRHSPYKLVHSLVDYSLVFLSYIICRPRFERGMEADLHPSQGDHCWVCLCRE